MTETALPRRRGASARAVLLAVLLCALVAVLVPRSTADAADPAPGHAHGQAAQPSALTASQLAFHDEMRRLWEDHVTWTRMAIVAFADESEGFPAAAQRLMQNQQDIGDAIKPFYGDAAGDRLADLLREHIAIAVEILQAAKTGDQAAFDEANQRWRANADAIGDFLAGANPRNWSAPDLRAAMQAHLQQTLSEAAHELGGQYEASVADYDEVHAHILAMADVLSTGIMRQFPARFR